MEEKIERAIKKLKKQRFLNKYRVINELFKESNNNSGILETSCVLTLKCPVSRIRIKTPIRFHQCKHAQCFDADSFFQLTLSSIIKKCPICNLQSSYNSLVVDGLFYEILKNTSDLDEHVILYSNGNWEVKKENNDEFKLHQKQNIGNSYYIDTNKIYNYSHKNQNFENHNTIYSNIMGSNNNTGNYIRNNHNHNHNHNNNNNKNINNNINNRKNVIYNCRIIDHNNYHCDDDQLSTSSPISRSISTISSNNDNYIEKTKKRLLEDLNCLKYGLQKTTLHNEVINNIDEQENDEIENKYYETNFDNNNKNDDINDKMRTIQEITNTIQRILNISINKSKDAINEINNIKDEDNQNNVANEEKEFENYSNTNTVNDNDNYKNNNNKYKHISNDNELQNRINDIEREIESSKKTKQTLLERSEYISSKFKSKTHGNKPMIIQMKTEKVKDNNKSKIIYYYTII